MDWCNQPPDKKSKILKELEKQKLEAGAGRENDCNKFIVNKGTFLLPSLALTLVCHKMAWQRIAIIVIYLHEFARSRN